MAKVKKKNKIVFTILAVLMLFSCLILPRAIVYGEDETTITYSNVLDDLKKDKSFNQYDYEYNPEDKSLQVIQIAESEDKELFIYVYQPRITVLASEINLSRVDGDIEPELHKLKLLNRNYVFAKYLVEDLEVTNDPIRYYNITSIYRLFDSNIDESPSGNTVSAFAYPVAQKWTAVTQEDDSVKYYIEGTEVVEVNDMFCGFVRYEGHTVYAFGEYENCDRHFVAFSTNWQIDQLKEIEICYSLTHYSITAPGKGPFEFIHEDHTDNVENDIVFDTDEGSYTSYQNLFKKHVYKWNRIETVTEFLNFVKDENLYSSDFKEGYTTFSISNSDRNRLKSYDWVLSYCETDYSYNSRIDMEIITWAHDVTMLRFKFETNGEIYNLGVVSNRQSESPNSPTIKIKTNSWWEEIKKWLKIACIVILSVTVLALVIKLIQWIAKA